MSNDFFDSIPEERSLNYKVIKEELRNVISSSINRIEREFPLDHINGAKALFRRLAYVAKNTYFSIVYLCDDKSGVIEFSLSAHPLLRVLLEEIFILIFISEELQTRIYLYYNGGWGKMKEEYDRLKSRFSREPDMVSLLENYERFLETTRVNLKITQAQVDNPKLLGHWPTPGRIKDKVNSSILKDQMQYLDDWFYIPFSQAAHLSLPGLINMGECLLPDHLDEKAAYLKKTTFGLRFPSNNFNISFLF